MSQEIFLEFKYLKNRIIDLGNGEQYEIPYRMEPSSILGHTTVVPAYNLEKVHKVKLLEEKPLIPEKEDGMSDRLHQELSDEAYRNAMDARRKNEDLRKRIDAYVKSGSIEIVNDPFKVKTNAEGEKSAPAPKPAKSASK